VIAGQDYTAIEVSTPGQSAPASGVEPQRATSNSLPVRHVVIRQGPRNIPHGRQQTGEHDCEERAPMAKGDTVTGEHPTSGRRPISEVRLTMDELMAPEEEADTEEGVQALDCHDMLLRMAGKAPDDLLARCCSWLAGHEFEALAKALTFFIISNNVPIAGVRGRSGG
jgi:hypothetical protein